MFNNMLQPAPFNPSIILSGAVNSGDLGDNTVFSGNIASGQIGNFHIASGQLQGTVLGSGQIVSGLIASGQIGSFHIASGQLTGFELGSGSIVSGRIASGQIGFNHLASGLYDYFLLPTVDIVSGVKAVFIASGNVVGLAMAGSGLRLPAVGIVTSNYLSGVVAQVWMDGVQSVPAGLDTTWSGMASKVSYLGSGGVICTQSGILSGMAWQRLGVFTSGGVIVQISPNLTMSGNLVHGNVF